jgi:NAD(P)H dehydrogenase (quinone)
MIVVTGATGHLGRAIVKALVNRVPVNQVGVSVRDLARAADLETLGVRIRQGNFDDPDSLQHAFEGASKVLIISSNHGHLVAIRWRNTVRPLTRRALLTQAGSSTLAT